MIDGQIQLAIEETRQHELSIQAHAINRHDQHLLLTHALESVIHFVESKFENANDLKCKEHVLENLNDYKNMVVYQFNHDVYKQERLNIAIQDKEKKEILAALRLLRKYLLDRNLLFSI